MAVVFHFDPFPRRKAADFAASPDVGLPDRRHRAAQQPAGHRGPFAAHPRRGAGERRGAGGGSVGVGPRGESLFFVFVFCDAPFLEGSKKNVSWGCQSQNFNLQLRG